VAPSRRPLSSRRTVRPRSTVALRAPLSRNDDLTRSALGAFRRAVEQAGLV
jgi:hypothetical protein